MKLVDADGRVVEVGDPQAIQDALASGYGVLRGETANLYSPDGQPVNVDAEELPNALQSGYRLATYDEVQSEKRRAELDEKNLEAVAAGAARGLAFGGSDYLLDKAGVASKETLRDLEAANPIASGVGEVIGILGGALATGGSGLVAKGGLATAAGATARLGQAAESAAAATRLVQGLEGGGALARAGAAAVRMGAQGAVEGAVYESAARVHDDWMNDREITTERLGAALMSGVEGAALGAATGGILGGLGSLALSGTKATLAGGRRLLGGGNGKVAKVAERELSMIDDAGNVVEQRVTDLGDSSEVFDPELEQIYAERGPLIASRTDDQPSIGEILRAQSTRKDVQQRGIREVESALNEFKRVEAEVDTFADIASKREVSRQLNGLVHKGRSVETEAVFDDVIGQLESMHELYGTTSIADGGGAAALKRLRAKAPEYRKVFVEALERGDVGDAAMALDDFKRMIGHESGTRNSTLAKAITGRTGDDGIYGTVRRHLEDTSLWGDFAETQKVVNRAWSERIRRQGATQARGLFVSKSGELAPNSFDDMAGADGKAIAALLDGIGDSKFDGQEAAVRRYLRAAEIDAKTRAAAWGSPELQARAAKMTELVDRVESVLTENARANAALEQSKAFVGDLEMAPTAFGSAVRLGAKLAGRAMGMMDQTPVSQMSRAMVAAQKSENATMDAAEGVLTKMRSNAVRFGRAAASATRDTSKHAPVIASMVRDAKSHEEAIARIQDLQDPNSNDRRAIRNRMSHVRSIDPEMADMLDGHVQKIADFLAARAGVPTTQPQPGAPIFDRFKQPAHAKGDTERLRRYARAAENPLGVMERIKGGDVSKEDVETLRELYPRMFARLQSRLLHGLTEMKSRPNYETRRAMEVLLGAPVDGASRPEAIKAIQQQIANRVVPEVAAAEMGSPSQGGTVTPGNARPPEIAGAYATRNQQILWGAQ